MDVSFPRALAWVLQSEGGNDDDPDDPGGRTSRGVIQKEYNAYLQLMGRPSSDVWQAPQADINSIYQRSYWLPYCPLLPYGVDYTFFDENVNAGLHEAVLILQRALGVTADGHIGMITTAAWKNTDPATLIDAMAQQRVLVYKQTRNFWKYGKGWLARTETCRQRSHSLIPT